jgi:hypothetical protein
MTPIERSLYALTRFEIGDEVLICGGIEGAISGIKVTTSGEDEYRIFYFDNSDNPKEEWFRDSMLDAADETDDPVSNVVAFPCRCEREDIAASRRATKH